MAIGVVKQNGSSLGVVAVDESALANSFGTRGGAQTASVQHFTVSRNPTFVNIAVKNGSSEAINLMNEFDTNTTSGLPESVEAILKVVADNASILGYAVSYTGSYNNLSVMVEGPHTQSTYGASANLSYSADLQARIQALGTAVGANSIDVSGSTVTDIGFKLATS